MNSDDQYASYNQRINAILNELSIINDRVSSLEERTEPSISDDKPINSYIDDESGIFKFSEFLRDYLDGRKKARTACDDSCQGDMLGQCELGCDGISDRGSCIDKDIERTAIRARLSKWAADTKASDGITAQCGRPADLCRSCSPAMHEAMSMPACKHGERSCKYELSDADSCDYSDKPRRARVDNDDAKYGSGLVDGLEGILGRCDSEQKANSRQMLDDMMRRSMECYRLHGCIVVAGVAYEWKDRQWVALELAPAQVVYCCNGAKYEAR